MRLTEEEVLKVYAVPDINNTRLTSDLYLNVLNKFTGIGGVFERATR